MWPPRLLTKPVSLFFFLLRVVGRPMFEFRIEEMGGFCVIPVFIFSVSIIIEHKYIFLCSKHCFLLIGDWGAESVDVDHFS